ncbi:YbaM family protein [Marinomonas sp. C2222]|uniref:YbaM family protein n=1 Tax=Marinomonas sargassi TaxID=2984494 RepID=A0ABT2YRQ0_9GAMM|nr:YbaM family protein [Marinomonas sargassi]MCV2402567.1 YbaM family protein [Marinomonas sargassi]
MSLENAPKHIQLAVDLIELLETNNVSNQLAVEALELVLADFKNKLEEEG